MVTEDVMIRTLVKRGVGPALLVAALLLGGCDSNGNRDVNVSLDSAGAKIERGMEKVGEKLDTAWTDVKTELNETRVEGMLRQMKGMDSVDVKLTPEGDMTLTGSVATEDRRQLAEQMAREMKGVRSVTNTITLGASKGPVNDSTISDTTGSGKSYQGQETKHPAKQ